MLCAVLALSALLILLLVPAPARQLPLAGVLVAASLEYRAIIRRPPPPDRIRLHADGRIAVVIATHAVPAVLLPGSLLTAGFGWLHWRREGRRATHWTLVCRSDNRRAWRRARLIWRWAPRPEVRRPFV